MRFTAAALAAAVAGRLDGEDVLVEGASADSRTLATGQLFVALRAGRDGHDFIAAALAAGASAYLTEGPVVDEGSAIVVDDTIRALTALGHAARRRLGGQVIGVTGSVGKTTVKELLSAALSPTFTTYASPMSYNNEIGVPLTLANAPDSAGAVVVEMGARGHGHISALCEIARPTVAVLTRVGQAHLEQFESLEGVARAKGELVEYIDETGLAVLNADDERVAAMAAMSRGRVVLYGQRGGAQVTARRLVLDALARPSFELVTPEGSAEVRLQLHGAHQVANALAALAAAVSLGVPVAAAAEAVSAVGAPRWRMSVQALGCGAVLVHDAYNANPTSVRAAFEALVAMEGTRRLVVLGEMAELGATAAPAHAAVAEAAADLGLELVAYRTTAYGAAPVNGAAALLERVGLLGPGDVVLVKGSRSAGMEELVTELVEALEAT